MYGTTEAVFIIDASSFIYRAYFQSLREDPRFQVRTDGHPIGAVKKFTDRMFGFYTRGASGISPSHVVTVFDGGRGGFRTDIYAGYKAHRELTPDDLKLQMPLTRDVVRAFGMKPVEIEGYEADDLIASYCRASAENGMEALIISADKDLMQLIRPGVRMFDPASGTPGMPGAREDRLFAEDDVQEKWGVPPRRVVDVQALAGDATDNVPGAPGIGVKTAAALVNQFGSVENVLANAHLIPQPKRRATLMDPEVQRKVRMSKELVQLDERIPLPIPLHDFRLTSWPGESAVGFMREQGFWSMARRAAETFGVAYEAAP